MTTTTTMTSSSSGRRLAHFERKIIVNSTWPIRIRRVLGPPAALYPVAKAAETVLRTLQPVDNLSSSQRQPRAAKPLSRRAADQLQRCKRCQ